MGAYRPSGQRFQPLVAASCPSLEANMQSYAYSGTWPVAVVLGMHESIKLFGFCRGGRQVKQTHLLVIGVCAFLGACSPNETGSATDAKSAQLTEIQVNGITLNYIVRGQGDTVLLVHGTVGDY